MSITEKKEYIERGAMIENIKSVYCAGCDNWNEVKCRACQFDDAMIQIGSAPAADVVEVVRCKNCKRSGMYAFGCGEQEHLACLDIEEDGFVRMATAVNDDDYCSRGERREE